MTEAGDIFRHSPMFAVLRRLLLLAGLLVGFSAAAVLLANMAHADEQPVGASDVHSEQSAAPPSKNEPLHQLTDALNIRDASNESETANRASSTRTPLGSAVENIARSAAATIDPVSTTVAQATYPLLSPLTARVLTPLSHAVSPIVEPITGPLLSAAAPVVKPIEHAISGHAISALAGSGARAAKPGTEAPPKPAPNPLPITTKHATETINVAQQEMSAADVERLPQVSDAATPSGEPGLPWAPLAPIGISGAAGAPSSSASTATAAGVLASATQLPAHTGSGLTLRDNESLPTWLFFPRHNHPG